MWNPARQPNQVLSCAIPERIRPESASKSARSPTLSLLASGMAAAILKNTGSNLEHVTDFGMQGAATLKTRVWGRIRQFQRSPF